MKIVDNISGMKKGAFGVTIVTETIPSMNKTNNPYIGRVKKVTTYTNAALGVSYNNTINRRLEKNGCEADYQSVAPRGKKWYNAFFYVSATDDSVFYLKIGMYKNTTAKSVYFVDGHEATADELQGIKSFEKPHNAFVQKQADAGLGEKEQYTIVAPNAANVISISLGEQLLYLRD